MSPRKKVILAVLPFLLTGFSCYSWAFYGWLVVTPLSDEMRVTLDGLRFFWLLMTLASGVTFVAALIWMYTGKTTKPRD